MSEATIKNHAASIWSVADLLQGDYKQSEYAKVFLPLVVLRRLDCVLEPTKAKRERKQALITAAVTGQLDLARDIAEEAS